MPGFRRSSATCLDRLLLRPDLGCRCVGDLDNAPGWRETSPISRPNPKSPSFLLSASDVEIAALVGGGFGRPVEQLRTLGMVTGTDAEEGDGKESEVRSGREEVRTSGSSYGAQA